MSGKGKIKKVCNKKNIIILCVTLLIIIALIVFAVILNKKKANHINLKKVNSVAVSYTFNSLGNLSDDKVVVQLNENEINELKEYLKNVDLSNEVDTKNVINGIYKIVLDNNSVIEFDRTDLKFVKYKNDKKEKVIKMSNDFFDFIDTCLDEGFEEQIEMSKTNKVTVTDKINVMNIESEIVLDNIKEQIKRTSFKDVSTELVGRKITEDIVIDFNNGSKIVTENKTGIERYAKLQIEGKEDRIIKIRLDILDQFDIYKQNQENGFIDLLNTKQILIENENQKIQLNEKESKDILQAVELSRITKTKEVVEDDLKIKESDVVLVMNNSKLVIYNSNESNTSVIMLDNNQYVKIKVGNKLKYYINNILNK